MTFDFIVMLILFTSPFTVFFSVITLMDFYRDFKIRRERECLNSMIEEADYQDMYYDNLAYLAEAEEKRVKQLQAKLQPPIEPAPVPLQIEMLPPEPQGKIICGVCGSSMSEDIVYCDRCGTPHHRRCWEYNGRCATYACGCDQCKVQISVRSDWKAEFD